jgi:hypothetical protein
MPEASILFAVCGCRYKVVIKRAEGSIEGVLERDATCSEHTDREKVVYQRADQTERVRPSGWGCA